MSYFVHQRETCTGCAGSGRSPIWPATGEDMMCFRCFGKGVVYAKVPLLDALHEIMPALMRELHEAEAEEGTR